MKMTNDSINYAIDELINAEKNSYWDKNDGGNSIQVKKKNSYLLRDAGCNCCSSEEEFTKNELIELIEKSIVQLQERVKELKKRNLHQN